MLIRSLATFQVGDAMCLLYEVVNVILRSEKQVADTDVLLHKMRSVFDFPNVFHAHLPVAMTTTIAMTTSTNRNRS